MSMERAGRSFPSPHLRLDRILQRRVLPSQGALDLPAECTEVRLAASDHGVRDRAKDASEEVSPLRLDDGVQAVSPVLVHQDGPVEVVGAEVTEVGWTAR